MAEHPGPAPREGPAPPPTQYPGRAGGGKAVVALVVVAVVALGGLAVYWLYLRGPEYPWLFKGAYAEYEGQTIILIVPVDVKVRLEVIDFNSTHAKLLFRLTVSALGQSNSSENITWVDLETGTFILGDARPNRTYEATLDVEGLGQRECIVQVFEDEESKIEFYVDKEYAWPLRIVIASKGFLMEITLDLKSTNIEQLKPG